MPQRDIKRIPQSGQNHVVNSMHLLLLLSAFAVVYWATTDHLREAKLVASTIIQTDSFRFENFHLPGIDGSTVVSVVIHVPLQMTLWHMYP